MTLADGRRFRVLAIVDDVSRECLSLVADTLGPACASRSGSQRSSGGKASQIRLSAKRHRIDQRGGPEMVLRHRCRLAPHRTGQANSQRVRQELHRYLPRRAIELNTIHDSLPRQRRTSPYGRRTKTETDRTRLWALSRLLNSQRRWLWRTRLHDARNASAGSPNSWREVGSNVVTSRWLMVRSFNFWLSLPNMQSGVLLGQAATPWPVLLPSVWRLAGSGISHCRCSAGTPCCGKATVWKCL